MKDKTDIFCKDLCAIFTIKFMFHVFFFKVEVAIWRVRLSILDLLKMKQLEHDTTPQSTTKQSDKCTVIQLTVGATP